MINIFVYVYKKDAETGAMSWQHRQGVYPALLSKRLDEELDSASFTFYTKFPETLPPLTMTRIELNDKNLDEENDTDYCKEKMYFLGNDSYVKVNSRLYEHTFNLVEPTKLLEGVKVDGFAVSQPADEAARKSLYDVLKELLAVTPLRTVQEAALERTGFRKAPYVVTDDAAVVAALRGVKSPEFRWDSQTTLRECLDDIAAMIDAVPRLTANAAETAFDTITFDFVNETKSAIESMGFAGEEMGFEESQYCSAVETQADNIVESDSLNASVVFPSVNGWITPRTENIKFDDKDENGVVIILPQNIEELMHIWLATSFSDGGANMQIKYESSNAVEWVNLIDIGIKEIDIIKYVVEKSQWDTLETKSNGNKIYQYPVKNNTFYWTQNDNKINILTTRYKSWLIFNTSVVSVLWESVLYDMFDAGFFPYRENTIYKTPAKDFRLYSKSGGVLSFKSAYYHLRVEYIPTNSNAKVRAVKTNKVNVGFVQSYNQRAHINSSEALGRAMKSTVEKMGVNTLKLTKAYKTLDGILQVGDVYMHEGEAYVVTVVNLELLSHRLAVCAYELSKNWSLLSRYVGIDRRFRSWNIPNDVSERNLTDADYCEITRGDGTTAGLSDGDVRLDNAPAVDFLSVLTTNLATDEEITTCWIFKDEYTEGNRKNLDGVMVPASAFSFGKSVVFYARTLDNLSAGKRMQRETIDGSDTAEDCCIDTYYCNDDGTLNEMTVMLGAICKNLNVTDSDAADLAPFARQGKPATSVIADYYLNFPDRVRFSQKYAVNKNPAEQLNFVYQIHFVTDLPDIVLGAMLAQNNPLIKSMSSRTFKVWSLKKKLPNGLIKLNDFYGKVYDDNLFYYYLSTAAEGGQIRSVTYFKDESIIGWAITDENDNLYIAQNSNEEISATNAIILKLRHTYHGQ